MAINIEQTLLDLTETCAAIKKGQEDEHEHLYGPNGTIPALFKLNTDRDTEHKALVAVVAENHRNITSKQAYFAGAGAATALLLKAGLSKIGLHF